MKQIIAEIRAHDDFLLIAHVSPDGDTLGSAVALKLALVRLGKRAEIALEGVVPHKLRFLTEYTDIHSRDTLPKRTYACAIAVDTATRLRLGDLQPAFDACGRSLAIDHHPTNERFCNYNWVEERASTGELILELLEAMHVPIDTRIANCLYAAIVTDTNNFVYSSVTPGTYRAAARLAEAGAEIPRLCDMIFFERSLGATRLISLGTSRIQLYADGRIATLYMTCSDVAACGAKCENCDVLVNYAQEIEGVEIAIFLNEMKDGRFKVSLRSNCDVDVARLAATYGGGGHKKAAGLVMTGKVSEIEHALVQRVQELLP